MHILPYNTTALNNLSKRRIYQIISFLNKPKSQLTLCAATIALMSSYAAVAKPEPALRVSYNSDTKQYKASLTPSNYTSLGIFAGRFRASTTNSYVFSAPKERSNKIISALLISKSGALIISKGMGNKNGISEESILAGLQLASDKCVLVADDDSAFDEYGSETGETDIDQPAKVRWRTNSIDGKIIISESTSLASTYAGRLVTGMQLSFDAICPQRGYLEVQVGNADAHFTSVYNLPLVACHQGRNTVNINASNLMLSIKPFRKLGLSITGPPGMTIEGSGSSFIRYSYAPSGVPPIYFNLRLGENEFGETQQTAVVNRELVLSADTSEDIPSCNWHITIINPNDQQCLKRDGSTIPARVSFVPDIPGTYTARCLIGTIGSKNKQLGCSKITFSVLGASKLLCQTNCSDTRYLEFEEGSKDAGLAETRKIKKVSVSYQLLRPSKTFSKVYIGPISSKTSSRELVMIGDGYVTKDNYYSGVFEPTKSIKLERLYARINFNRRVYVKEPAEVTVYWEPVVLAANPDNVQESVKGHEEQSASSQSERRNLLWAIFLTIALPLGGYLYKRIMPSRGKQ